MKTSEEIIRELEEIHGEAAKFVKEKFDLFRMSRNDERITLLAIMRMMIDIRYGKA